MFANKPVFGGLFYGDQIVTAGADRLISFWDKKSGRRLKTLTGHQAEINGLDISNNLMMTSDVDGITKFWDLNTFIITA